MIRKAFEIILVVHMLVGLLLLLICGCGDSERRRIAEQLELSGGVVVADDELPNDRVVRIILRGSKVSDEQLDHLTDLEHLRHLYLDDSEISNDGLVKISALPTIEMLSIRNTQVDDECISSIAKLQSLRWLYISQTGLTQRGIRKLRKALPNTRIVE